MWPIRLIDPTQLLAEAAVRQVMQVAWKPGIPETNVVTAGGPSHERQRVTTGSPGHQTTLCTAKELLGMRSFADSNARGRECSPNGCRLKPGDPSLQHVL